MRGLVGTYRILAGTWGLDGSLAVIWLEAHQDGFWTLLGFSYCYVLRNPIRQTELPVEFTYSLVSNLPPTWQRVLPYWLQVPPDFRTQ